MRVPILVVGCLVVVPACEKKSEPPPKREMRVAFGDCAAPASIWASGPLPQPLEGDQAGLAAKAVTAPIIADARTPRSPSDPRTVLQEGGAFASLTGTADISSGLDDATIYGGLLGNEPGEMNGGFGYGRSGFGPGGGGTGWGTIGTGKYGTIGSGYGVGSGRGGMRGRSSAVPTVSIGQPSATGDLDKAIIRRYIKRNIQKLQYCYEKALLAKPKLSGTVASQFTIAPNGTVASASADGVDPAVSACVAQVIKNIEFPKPKGGGAVEVRYPFTFRPAGAGSSPPPPTAGSGSAAGSDDRAGTGSTAKPADPAPKKPTGITAANYQPGALNPLRDRTEQLADCFRGNGRPYGELVVELAYDTAGAVTSTTVHGNVDETVRSCVADAARATRAPAGSPAGRRCSLAFGVQPVADLPDIELTADSVVYNGKTVASLSSVTKADKPIIDPLRDAIRPRVATALAGKAPPLTVFGPGVIRPFDTTPMKAVHAALATAADAGDDFVLAYRADNAWKLLRPVTLPIVPVPLGTGGAWHQLKVFGEPPLDNDERPVVAILVTKTDVWIGISRVNEFIQIKRDDKEPSALIDALKKQKASSFFVDRTDLEVAGSDDLPYRDITHVIEAAIAAGFSDWRLTNEAQLVVKPAL